MIRGIDFGKIKVVDETISDPPREFISVKTKTLSGIQKDLNVWFENYNTEKDIRQKRAPTGLIFVILAVYAYNWSNSEGTVALCLSDHVVDIHEMPAIISLEKTIFSFPSRLDSVHLIPTYVNFSSGIRTKYMTLGVNPFLNINSRIYIYYKLAKATENELIWEYARKHTRTG